ncbi:hypothetical protein [Archaeoglobus neptunius]|nr:hypothetical protein [Archaeoglobus neptunius]
MESHVKWGIGFIVIGVIMEVTLPFILLIDTLLIAAGILLLIFGGGER